MDHGQAHKQVLGVQGLQHLAIQVLTILIQEIQA